MIFSDDWEEEVAGCKASTTFLVIKIFQSLFSQFFQKEKQVQLIHFSFSSSHSDLILMQKLVQKAQDVKELIISKKGRRKNTSYTKVVEEILIL